MTKTQIRFRLKRMEKDINFLFMNAPFSVSAGDVEAIHKVVERLRKRADVKL
jgi:CRISPR/Cas system endoribonuclease Cas6 (RAMP superfamily)